MWKFSLEPNSAGRYVLAGMFGSELKPTSRRESAPAKQFETNKIRQTHKLKLAIAKYPFVAMC